MLSARRAIPLVAVACLAGAALLFPAQTRNAWQTVARLTGLASTDADAQDSGASSNGTASRRGAAGPIPVSVARAEKAPFPIIVRTFGTVQSPAVVVVGGAHIEPGDGHPRQDGQMVKAGDLLISLDDRVVRATRPTKRCWPRTRLLVKYDSRLGRARTCSPKGAGTAQAYDAAVPPSNPRKRPSMPTRRLSTPTSSARFHEDRRPDRRARPAPMQVSVGDLVGGGSASGSSGTPAPAW